MATKIPLSLGNQAWDMMASAQQIDQCCGFGRGVNMLDNWYLRPGVINQRGDISWVMSTKSKKEYHIDRWWNFAYSSSSSDATVSLGDMGMTLPPWVIVDQSIASPYREFLISRSLPMVLSCLYLKSGSLYCDEVKIPAGGTELSIGGPLAFVTFGDGGAYGAPMVEIKNPGPEDITVVAAKLEIGTEQTLAHREGDTWVLNDPPPNPTLELLKCMRYQQVLNAEKSNTYIFGYGWAPDTYYMKMIYHLPVSMRIPPASLSRKGLFLMGKGLSLTTSNPIYADTISLLQKSTQEVEIKASGFYDKNYQQVDVTKNLMYSLHSNPNGISMLILDSNL